MEALAERVAQLGVSEQAQQVQQEEVLKIKLKFGALNEVGCRLSEDRGCRLEEGAGWGWGVQAGDSGCRLGVKSWAERCRFGKALVQSGGVQDGWG